MGDLLTWLSAYSLPVVLLLVSGAGVLLIVRQIIENAIKSQFERYGKELALRLERRSRFEEKLALDQYLAATDLFARLQTTTTNLNRVRSGQVVPGFLAGAEVVPLTAVFEEVDAKRYLLGPELHPLLFELALAVLNWAQRPDDEAASRRLGESRARFHDVAGRVFGIDRVHATVLP